MDASKRYEILSYLKKLNQELRTTMFIITHDLEAALICDKAAILREGRMLDFNSPQTLIHSLPIEGKLARITIENLNEKIIESIKKFRPIKKILRAGNDMVEIMMEDFDSNLPKLIQFIIDKKVNITGMSRDLASFRRYFQIRVQEEEEKELDLYSIENKSSGESM